LFSDTHGYFNETFLDHIVECDEIWHAGDFGQNDFLHRLENGMTNRNIKAVLRGVFGNIDDAIVRGRFPELLVFECEQVKVMMKHIGGYPGRYAPGVKNEILLHKPGLFISGHSHILKIMYDQQLNCLHINPGAAGNQGWHKTKTMVRFVIDGSDIKDCEIIEMGPR
jgi:putative phosphoesterase